MPIWQPRLVVLLVKKQIFDFSSNQKITSKLVYLFVCLFVGLVLVKLSPAKLQEGKCKLLKM